MSRIDYDNDSGSQGDREVIVLLTLLEDDDVHQRVLGLHQVGMSIGHSVHLLIMGGFASNPDKAFLTGVDYEDILTLKIVKTNICVLDLGEGQVSRSVRNLEEGGLEVWFLLKYKIFNVWLIKGRVERMSKRGAVFFESLGLTLASSFRLEGDGNLEGLEPLVLVASRSVPLVEDFTGIQDEDISRYQAFFGAWNLSHKDVLPISLKMEQPGSVLLGFHMLES